MEFFAEFGHAGMFFSSFLAATILPLSSEIVLSVLLLNGSDPVLLTIVATTGNVLGSCVNYAAGLHGSMFIITKVLKTSEKAFAISQKRFNKYGIFSLLFAWAPFIGDPLTIIAGVLRVNFILFFTLVAIGKLTRYIILSQILLTY